MPFSSLRIPSVGLFLCLIPLTGGAQEASQAGTPPVPAAETALETEAPAVPAVAKPGPLTFATYNLGLAHGAVALAAERLPHLATALGELDADVVCLQEVWLDEDAATIQTALAADYPHSFRQVTVDTSDATTPCPICSTLRLSRCVTKKCEKNGISAEECVSSEPCQERYDALDDTCKRCLAANTADAASCAMGGAQEYAWAGRNGLLLLSRQPLDNAAYHAFDALLVTRGVITADVQDYHLMCTHLSADLGVVPYAPGQQSMSWEDEHKNEVVWMVANTPAERCSVLLGDLNAGPAYTSFTAELPSSWALLPAAGFREPWTDPPCTWCKENPLAGSTVDKVIDHVLFKGCPDGLQVDYQRIMDQPLVLEGLAEPTRYSDHYGLMATPAW